MKAKLKVKLNSTSLLITTGKASIISNKIQSDRKTKIKRKKNEKKQLSHSKLGQ